MLEWLQWIEVEFPWKPAVEIVVLWNPEMMPFDFQRP
jgi:hypothetical protein